jgi:hypothetical protein
MGQAIPSKELFAPDDVVVGLEEANGFVPSVEMFMELGVASKEES